MGLRFRPTLAVLTVCAAAAAGAPGAPTAAVAVLDPQTGCVGARRARPVTLEPESPPDLPPPADVREGRFGVVPLPGGFACAVALDIAPGFERVWVDRDLDGRLDDEEALTWTQADLSATVNATTRIPTDAGPVPVALRIHRGAFTGEDEVRVDGGRHRWGAASLGEKLVLVAAEDADGNLRYDDDDDRVYVDLDGDGRFDSRPGSSEITAPGEFVEVAGRSYEVRMGAASGETVEFLPAPDAVATGAAGIGVENLEVLLEHARSVGGAAARSAAFTALAATGADDALVHLGAVAKGPDLDAALDAVRALRSCPHPGRLDLLATLLVETGRVEIARACGRELGFVQEEAARSALHRFVTGDARPNLRHAAYLGARQTPRGVASPAVLACAEDRHPPLRAAALSDLYRRRHPSARVLALAESRRGCRSEVAPAVIRVLAAGGDAEAASALVLLGRAPHLRDRVLDAFVESGDGPHVAQLVKHLSAEEMDDRLLACEALRDLPFQNVTRHLLARLGEEPEHEVRLALLEAIGEHGDPRAFDVLRKFMEEGSAEARRFAFRAIGRPGMRDHPRAVDLLRQELRHDLWESHLLAIQAVVRSGNAGLLPEIHRLLAASHRRVRLAAAEALGELRRRASVKPLVDRLADEGNLNVRRAIGVSLFRLTGTNLYDDADLWKKWWESEGARFQVPDVPPDLPREDVAGTKAVMPTFYGIPIDSESVVFVIDISGSMAAGDGALPMQPPAGDMKTRFDRAREELLAAVAALEDGNLVNVVLFEDMVRRWSRDMRALNPRIRRSLTEHLNRQEPQGATNLFDALEIALAMRGAESIVVLSDGEPNRGKYVSEPAILSKVRELNQKRGLVIHCVALGRHSTLLSRMAEEHHGKYVVR